MNISDTYSDIISAIQRGSAQEAERRAREALRKHHQDENLLVLLALSLQYQQRLPEAVAVYAELTLIFPNSALHWGNYASALNSSNALDQAKVAFQRAVELDPANQAVRDQYGLLLLDCREYLAAREMLLAAHLLNRDVTSVRVHAAKACGVCQDFQNAAELLKHWRAWLPLADDVLQLELARALSLRGDTPGTAWLLEDLLIRQPNHFDARLLLACIYERQNRLDDALILGSQLAATEGTKASQRNEVDHLLANLALRRGDAALARSLLEAAGPQDGYDDEHFFLLAGVCDKLRDVPAALRALHDGHAITARLLCAEKPEHFTPEAAALPMETVRVDADQYRRWPLLSAPDMRDSPIFVVGFPRSGTTLLEQMLDAHPGLQSMDENAFFNLLVEILRGHDVRTLDDLSVLRQYDCDELRKRYHQMVGEKIERKQGTRLVDKNPLNMQWLPVIHRLFPAAKIILAVRHPCDVVLSCYMQHFRSTALATACVSLERLARAYVATMQQWLADVEILQPDVLISRYENLVEDFPHHAAGIAGFLELDDFAPLLQFDKHARGKSYIATPSYSQVIEPITPRAVNRWLPYREAFEPILPILQPMLDHWGYSVD